MKKFLRSLWAFLGRMKPRPEKVCDLLSELAMIAGFVLFSYGVYLIYVPAGYMVAGLALFLLGFPASKFKRGSK
jgi:hypothetical protein